MAYRGGPGNRATAPGRATLASIAALVAVMALLAACSGDDDAETTPATLTPASDEGVEEGTGGTGSDDGTDAGTDGDDGSTTTEPEDSATEDGADDDPEGAASTTSVPPSTATDGAGGAGGDRFGTLPVGADLPSGAECAGRVTPTPEIRAGNEVFNTTRGSGPNGRYPRVDGDFTGTTDEILQWVACKWGIDEDIVRAQAAIESWWDMTTAGDRTTNQDSCHPQLRTDTANCPESIGLLQVRYDYHLEAFENADAIRSTAYNVDYAYAVWRSCYDGELAWLNDVERGATYEAGDERGCLGVWFSGRWYTDPALEYMARVDEYHERRIWEEDDFRSYG